MLVQQSMYLLLLILSYFTPFLFSVSTNEGFEMPKTFFIYIVSILLFLLYSLGLIYKKVQYKKLPYQILMYVCVAGISTVFSSHLYTSFWGYYSRFNGGLFSIFCMVIIYISARTVVDHAVFLKLLRGILIGSILISFYAILQHFAGVPRVYSTLGHPNWLAQYYVLILPLLLLKITKEENPVNIWSFAYILGFSSLWFTYSLSGLLAFLLCFLYTVFFIYKKNQKLVNKLLLPVFIGIIIAFLNPGLIVPKLNDMFIDIKARVSSIHKVYAQDKKEGSYMVSDPGNIRFGLWLGTLEAIFSNRKIFLVGNGLETFAYGFSLNRPLSLNYSSEWDFVFNKPHNYFLEIWYEMGIIGLITFVILLIVAFRKSPKWLYPFWVGYIVTNFFGWPSVYVNMLFWIFLITCHEEQTFDY